MTGQPPHQRVIALLLTFGILTGLVSGAAALSEEEGVTPGWWSAAALGGGCVSLALAALAALGRVPARWGARCLLVTTTLSLVTLPLVSHATFTALSRPWVETLVPIAVAGCALVSRSWWRSCAVGVAVVLLHSALQLADNWQINLITIIADALFNITVLSMFLAVILALSEAHDRLREEAAETAASYVRARTTEQLSRHNARWDALLHDQILAALETIARAETGDRARSAARAAAVQLVEGPAPGEVDAVTLRDELLQAVLSTYPMADTRFPRAKEEPTPVPASVTQALVMGVSEALRNVARHAYPEGQPGPAVVELVHDGRGVRVSVQDRGGGFRREEVPATSFGVALSIENRMDAVGGHGRVASTPGAGTIVELSWAPGEIR